MRLLPILVLVTALALAGCAKKADDGGSTTTTPPTTSTTPTGGSTSPTTPTGSTPTGTTPTTPTDNGTGGGPTPVMQIALCAKKEYDYSAAQPDPANPGSFAPGSAACGTAVAGYTSATVFVNWTDPSGNALPVGGVSLANGIDVKLIDSAKKAVATCAGPQGPITNPTKCTGTLTGPGDYKLQFDGGGAVKASVSVNIS